MHVRSLVVTLLLLGDCLARPPNLVDEIEDLYAGFDALASDDITESNEENLESYDWKQDDSTTFYNDPEIREIAEREYENAMGRIIAVNLAHWRKRQQKGTEQAQQDKREYQENVQEKIETVNQENGFFFYQGDVILDCELYEELHPGKKCRREEQTETRKKRNALRSRKRLWTSRVIPYMVPSFMSHITSNLMKAIRKIQGSTCLRFVRYNGHKNYITFDESRGCSSRVGKRYAEAGKQTISLGDGCNFESTITHELLHALGFFHEQAREDRNKFVEIKWENILDGFSDQFDKYAFNTIDNVGKDYDFQSVMHYDRKAFTKNGLDTIVRVDNPNENFGMPGGKALSSQDIAELNALYDCRTRYYGWTQWSRFTPCDDNCMKERQRYCYHSGNPKSCGGNVNAYGIETVKVKCGRYECPAKVDGHWGRWSEWTNCDAQCDDGKRKRYRICDNPVPKHGGKYCPGNSKEEGLCTLRRCRLGYDDTDFDSKILGMWRNAGQIQWLRNKYFTKTMDTGPNGDHTTGKGYYLYMESSSPARAGARASLESPWLRAPRGGQCMKFFYSMFGKTMGSLFVVLQQRGKRPVTIFAKNRNQGIYWIGAKVSLDIPEGVNYKIKIFAQIGQPGYSDIAIDDVYFDPGLCFCQDDYVSCPKWKAQGYCRKDVNFMSKHCAMSCDTCECKDDNANCPGWAAQPNGCEKNRAYMRGNCKKSCKVCHPPKGQTASISANKGPKVCKDSDETQCPIWAKMGECKTNPWMNEGCALSCGICVCKDNHARCAEWEKIGECDRNKNWMQDNCAKSCRVCGARS